MEKEELRNQLLKVKLLLEERLKNDSDRAVLLTLHERYSKAIEIVESNQDIEKIMIAGGCRAYLDAFSDYMNPMLIEMDKAENMLLLYKESRKNV